MNPIKFTIIGKPIAKQRARSCRHCVGGRFITKHYTPQETTEWERSIALQALKHKPRTVPTCAVSISMIFYFARPKSLPEKVQAHVRKPDIDNLEKLLCDSLEGLFYKNDSQIYHVDAWKEYSKDKSEGVAVLIEYEDEKK